ncbi:MAG TPA: tetratricopeptide repeat protein [Candidatus Eisenbacteria bacterium]|jgi:TolA-binding protein|nr:tetratricopeptide repeat protein [Candidatus Eisenbacteria bacterium]
MSTHLVKHQKITKRQMKEDPLVTAAFRATEVWEQFGRRILMIAGALVLVGLLVFFVARTRAQAEQRAMGDLFRATVALNQGDAASASPMLRELVDNSPGTKAAREAMRLLGDATLAQKNAGEAATWYQKYVDKSGGDKEAQKAGYLGLGAALENGGRFRPAADAYAKVADLSKTDNEKGRAMLMQARALARAGQNQKAIEIYTKVAAMSGAEIPIRDAANMHLGELSVTTPTSP